MNTNTFRFSQVEEGFSSKLSVFEKPKMDTAVVQHSKERIYPTSAVTQGGPIMFRIDPSVGYIDGANTDAHHDRQSDGRQRSSSDSGG